ncbi:MAG: antitoxin [Propionibacteriaceae bacterium]|nr:antitoxin [Propionibacteriaceae bacterium]
MTDQPQQFGNTGEYIDKAKGYAQENPDHARSFIDKVEDFVDEKTGGKHAAQVDQAGDWVEGQLGLPNNTNNPDPDPQNPAGQAPAPGQDPAAPADPGTEPRI